MDLAKKVCSLCLTLIAMLNSVNATNYTVSVKTDLQAKYTAALPGDTVIVSNGTYDWGQLVLSNSNGTTTSNWIVIKAQTLNGVVFTGSTYMQFGGKRIMITGFKFANGNAGLNDVIQFRSSTSVSNYAQYCRLNNITIVNYSSDSTGAFAGLSTAIDNKWVSLYGIKNRIDHCTFIDKYNGGATIVIWYDNTNYPQQSTSTYHLIDSNYFNKRSFTAGNGGESIRVGVGLTSSTYGYNTIEYNLFENLTQAEPEIVSNKSGFNTYRYNTFKNCSGGLTLRRGRYCSVYGNFFMVNKSTLTDDYGIRIIDKGHKVFNNYIEGINGNKNSLTAMRCPIVLYNGTYSVNDTTDPSHVNNYMPTDSCIVAFNTIVNCQGGAGISLGYTDNGGNTYQPLGITIANNLIKMTSGQGAYNPSTNTSLTYTASGNIYNAPSGVGLSSSTGFTSTTLNFGSIVNGILTPPSFVQDAAINTSSYSSMLNGLDVNGLTRSSIYDVGCDEINSTGSVIAAPLDSTQVGAGMPLKATIKSFTPAIAYNGTTVTIKGTNFVNVSNLNFGGTNATGFTVLNDSIITAVVSSGTSGNINITANGFVSKITGFTFCSPHTSTTNVSICPSALPYSWNGNRTAAGTYTFTTTNSQGCDSVATLNLTIGSEVTPTVFISTSTTTICSASSTTFAASGVNGGPSPIYRWKQNGVNVGVGTSITFLPNTLSNGDVISCVLTSNNPCQTTSIANSNTIPMTVKSSPSIGTSIIGSATLCTLGSTTTVYNTNTQGGGVWTSSNTSVAVVSTSSGAVGTVTAIGNGTDTLTYIKTSSNGCSVSASTYLTVAQASIPASITGTNNVCKGFTTTLSTAATGGFWNTTSSSIASVNSTTGVVTGNGAGVSVIKYTITNGSGCSASSSYNVTVNPTPPVPTIQYALGTLNPQLGLSGAFCPNKTFTVVGNPAGGVWSSTGVLSVNASTGLINTGSTAGSGSLTYTITVNGCVNSRSISGAVAATCASHRGNTEISSIMINDNLFTIYPNPAKGFVSISINKITPNRYLVLNDFAGRIISKILLTESVTNFSTSNLVSGMYTIQLLENNQIIKTIPFIIASN